MIISRIKLYQFRSYDLYEAEFGESGTIIVGPNGTGKTNLLEAVYVALRGNTFRGSLVDTMQHNVDQTIIQIDTDSGTRRVELLKSANGKLNKDFILDDSHAKVLARKNRAPVVLFEPNDLRLITSSPSRRRDFLDGILSRTDVKFEKTLRAFNRTLLQRNELLKHADSNGGNWRDHLFAWDIKFVQLASAVANSRAQFLYNNEPEISKLYNSLSGEDTPLGIEYIPSVPLEQYEQSLLSRLQKSLDYEVATGHTSAGPHREDFTIYLYEKPAIKVASRGEMRTIMLAFKLLELKIQDQVNNNRSIILMDDVFSELDATREKLLQETIRNHQCIITTTDTRHQQDGGVIISTKNL